VSDTDVKTPDPDDDDNENTDAGVDETAFPEAYDGPFQHLKDVTVTFPRGGVVGVPSAAHAEMFRAMGIPFASPTPPQKEEESAPEPQSVKLYGMDRLADMSREALIEEMLDHNRTMLQRCDREQLIRACIDMRLTVYKLRLTHESGLGGWSFSIEQD